MSPNSRPALSLFATGGCIQLERRVGASAHLAESPARPATLAYSWLATERTQPVSSLAPMVSSSFTAQRKAPAGLIKTRRESVYRRRILGGRSLRDVLSGSAPSPRPSPPNPCGKCQAERWVLFRTDSVARGQESASQSARDSCRFLSAQAPAPLPQEQFRFRGVVRRFF